jgi:hypothetical protein
MNVLWWQLLSHSANFDYHFIIALVRYESIIQDILYKKKKDATELALKSDSLTNALKKMKHIYSLFKSLKRTTRIC